jgi:hypothetical protein
MNGAGHPRGRRNRSSAVGRSARLAAARALVGVAICLLWMVARAYRVGYLGLAQVETWVRISAKLRARACRLVGASMRGVSCGSVVRRAVPPEAGAKSAAVTCLSHSGGRARAAVGFARPAPANRNLLLTRRLH